MVNVLLSPSGIDLGNNFEQILRTQITISIPVHECKQVFQLLLNLFLNKHPGHHMRKLFESKLGLWSNSHQTRVLFKHWLWNLKLQLIKKHRQVVQRQRLQLWTDTRKQLPHLLQQLLRQRLIHLLLSTQHLSLLYNYSYYLYHALIHITFILHSYKLLISLRILNQIKINSSIFIYLSISPRFWDFFPFALIMMWITFSLTLAVDSILMYFSCIKMVWMWKLMII